MGHGTKEMMLNNIIYIEHINYTIPTIYDQLWKIGIQKQQDESLADLYNRPVLVNNMYARHELSKIDNTLYNEYIVNADPQSILFFDDFSAFYADSYQTFIKAVLFGKWLRHLDLLPDLYINQAKKDEKYYAVLLHTWLYKHEIKYKFIHSNYSPTGPVPGQ